MRALVSLGLTAALTAAAIAGPALAAPGIVAPIDQSVRLSIAGSAYYYHRAAIDPTVLDPGNPVGLAL